VDWKPERVVQAKSGIFKNENKERLLKHAKGRTLRGHLQMATSPRPSIDNELSSQGASTATVCQVSHRQWPDLFTITSTPRKFAECLYCDVSLPPILHIMSCSIESPVICSLYGRSNHILTFIHSCIHTSILSYTHTFKRTQHTQYQFTHDCISRPESCLVISHQFNHQFFQVACPK